jgi:transcriptional regulator with XRE-family HTH domain
VINLVENLKKLRVEAELSQQQLAIVIGVSQQSINKYENHGVEPDIATLITLAKYFDTSVDYLIGNTDIRRKYEIIHPYDLNPDEKELIDNYRKATHKDKKIISLILSDLE